MRVGSGNNFGDDAGADGAAAFANREAQALFHRDRQSVSHDRNDVVARHHHLGARRQFDASR
jgi:hypothetical protein